MKTWDEQIVKDYFRDNKQTIHLEDGREIYGALSREETDPKGELIVLSKILELGTKLKLSTGWWQIIDHQGYGLDTNNETLAYRVYYVLPLPIFKIEDRIKIKYGKTRAIVLGVNMEENYYLVKVRGVEQKWSMLFQDKYMLMDRSED